MKSRDALLAGAAALAGALAGVIARRRRAGSVEPPSPEEGDPRAEALRRRLEEARGLDEERDEFEAAETPVDEVEPAGAALEARRRAVHERGRSAADEMRGGPASPVA